MNDLKTLMVLFVQELHRFDSQGKRNPSDESLSRVQKSLRVLLLELTRYEMAKESQRSSEGPQASLELVTSETKPRAGRRRWKYVPQEPTEPKLTCLLGYKAFEWSPLPESERRFIAEVYYDKLKDRYVRRLSRGPELFREDEYKRYERGHARTGFERKLRIPWVMIDAGESWKSPVTIEDWYLKRKAEDEFDEWVDCENDRRLCIRGSAD